MCLPDNNQWMMCPVRHMGLVSLWRISESASILVGDFKSPECINAGLQIHRSEKEENRVLLLKVMDTCFNGFVSGLRKLTPELTDEDLMYCCLFKLDVRTTDIALMLCLSCSTVSTRRKRIEKKMGNE